MDYKLAAVKLLCSQLKEARPTASQKSSLTLGGILFQRAWLQGVLVADGDSLFLDDATSLCLLSLPPDLFRLNSWTPAHFGMQGMYVMVVGHCVARTDEPPMIKVHKIVDLSAFPDREAMWYLEVIEAFKLFYESLIEEFS